MATPTLYEETAGLLAPARVSYGFTIILDLWRDDKLVLKSPPGYEGLGLNGFKTKTADLTEFNNGNGLSLEQILVILQHNEKAIEVAFEEGHFTEIDRDIVGGAAFAVSMQQAKEETEDPKTVYLAFHRSIQQRVACVYTILKDTLHKTIVVSFRGSVSGITRDWSINLTPGTTHMKTPEKIKEKMPEHLRDGILIRAGFHEYLFDNEAIEGKQRYDSIRADIQKLLQGETGYKVYVTGHSLGGALASIFSTWLAGGAPSEDMYNSERVAIPKPVTCITWAAPFSGTTQYRLAHELLEREGLLRSVRVNNYDDIVPTIPPTSWLVFGARMVHVGINVRLTNPGSLIEHSSQSGFGTALRNSILKPVWRHFTRDAHGLITHGEGLEQDKEKLSGLTIDDLYKDPEVVSQDFIDGNLN